MFLQQSAGACHLSNPWVTPGLEHSTLRSCHKRHSGEQPSVCGIHELTAPSRHSMTITRHLVVSYTTFSPLPCFHLKTQQGGYFLLPTPTVTNSFYFRKWDALCCPDFPLVLPWRPATRRGTAFCILLKCKGTKNFRKEKDFSYWFSIFHPYKDNTSSLISTQKGL